MAHLPLRSSRLLDQLRERIRYAHYSLRTEKTYVYWVRFFIRFHRLRHPKEMGAAEIQAFLSFLANDRKVAPSTHRQALAAILYLYKEVLDIRLPWMDEIGDPGSAFTYRSCFRALRWLRCFTHWMSGIASSVSCCTVPDCACSSV
jgi:hypothetical protein